MRLRKRTTAILLEVVDLLYVPDDQSKWSEQPIWVRFGQGLVGLVEAVAGQFLISFL